jgi:archaemetzincin
VAHAGTGELQPEMLLVPVGDFPRDLLYEISYRARIPIGPVRLDPAIALNPARGQYDSTRLLAQMKALFPGGTVIGVAACDLYIPVLTFVFGEAEMPGRAAIFSIYRLREEFYGLPPNRPLLVSRALRELWHEAGHLRGLAHCPDWNCVMSSSHSVELVDSKSEHYCGECARKLRNEVGR